MGSISKNRFTSKANDRSRPQDTPTYEPLDVRCPRCGADRRRSCVSSSRRPLHNFHRQRQELAASEFRSAKRLEILTHIRSGPFALAFSTRRMAQDDCNQLRKPQVSYA